VLELAPTGFLSTNFAVSLDGAALTTVQDTHGPVSGRFDHQGVRYFIDTHAPGGTGWSMLGAVLKSAVGRGVYALTLADRVPLAVARQRGLSDTSFDLTIGSQQPSLVWQPQAGNFVWDGGAGRVERMPGNRRAVRAHLPASLSPPLQVFIALLAQSRWEYVGSGGAG
jgi:hypothetical protein